MSEMEIPDWAINVPPEPAVHTRPARTAQWESLSEDQIKQLRRQLLESILAVVTQAFTGLFMPGPFGSAFDQLKSWADSIDEFAMESLTSLFARIEAETGVDLSAFLPIFAAIDMSSPEAFFASLLDAILAVPAALGSLADQIVAELERVTGINLTQFLTIWQGIDLSSPVAFLTSLAKALFDTTNLFLGPGSALNALNLFNLVPTDLMAHIPASNIGTFITNLITDPNFLDPGVISGWLHSPTGGYGGTGSRTVTADGSTKELLGNLIPVSEGQVLPISGRAKWTGLAGTGNPIALGVTGYLTDGATAQTIVASHNATPATTDWLSLSGTYTVPANVASIRTRLIVQATATAGTVSFSTVKATKVGPMLQRLMAGTNPGEILTDDITHLFTGIVTNTQALLNKAGLTDFNDLVSTIGGQIGNDIAAVEQRLDAFLHGQSPLNAGNINTGAVSDQFVPGLSTIHDAVVKAVGNLSGSGFDIGKVLEVLTGQTNSVVASSTGLVNMHSRLATAESRLAALPVSLGGTGVGISFGGIVGSTDLDDFERVSSAGLGSAWLQYYSTGGGTWATPNGHDAEYMWSGTSNREFVCIRNNAALLRSLTDYQRVTNVLSSKGTRHYDALLGTYNYCGHNDVLLRVSDATTSLANLTCIRIRWGSDGSISITRFLNGVATVLKSYPTGTLDPPGPGAALIGEAGNMNGGAQGQRYFRGIIGNNIAIEVTETGVASGFGAAFRRWGHGGRVEGWAGVIDNGQERPGSLHHWSAMDQVFA